MVAPEGELRKESAEKQSDQDHPKATEKFNLQLKNFQQRTARVLMMNKLKGDTTCTATKKYTRSDAEATWLVPCSTNESKKEHSPPSADRLTKES